MSRRDNTKKDDDSGEMAVSIRTLPWQVKFFVLALLVPTTLSFHLGEFRLTGYRLVLLLFFVPCFAKIFSGKNGRALFSDWMLLGYSLWMLLALYITSGFASSLKSGGILIVESFGAYLLARSFVRDEKDFAALVKMLFFIVIGLSLVTIPEALTGKNVLQPFAGHIGGRLGLIRAFGPFDHPILYGVFCGSIFSLALYVPIRNLQERGLQIYRGGWVVVATFMSVSSGALASVFVQFILACWERLTKQITPRWRIFTFLLVLVYIIIDLFSNRTPMRVILHRLTFSAETAYNRLIIWEWGTKHNVAEHPWFGIGFGEWVRPSWMHSLSMDNFWLVNMVRYGLPTFAFLAIGGLGLMFIIQRQENLSEAEQCMRRGWGFSLIGLIIAGCTVHFWNNLHTWFFFMLGSGAWMATKDKD